MEAEWGERAVQNFVRKSMRVLNQITENPYIFKASKSKDVRKGFITKQTSLIYRVKKKEIELLFFWDNRQDPAKLKL